MSGAKTAITVVATQIALTGVATDVRSPCHHAERGSGGADGRLRTVVIALTSYAPSERLRAAGR
jgi:hypothetical protein